MTHRQSIFPAFFLIALGVFFLLRNAGMIRGRFVQYLISVALILWGITKLVARSD